MAFQQSLFYDFDNWGLSPFCSTCGQNVLDIDLSIAPECCWKHLNYFNEETEKSISPVYYELFFKFGYFWLDDEQFEWAVMLMKEAIKNYSEHVDKVKYIKKRFDSANKRFYQYENPVMKQYCLIGIRQELDNLEEWEEEEEVLHELAAEFLWFFIEYLYYRFRPKIPHDTTTLRLLKRAYLETGALINTYEQDKLFVEHNHKKRFYVESFGEAIECIKRLLVDNNWKNSIANPYYRSERWKNRRANYIATVGDRCEKCRRGKIKQIHHKSYKRFGDEDNEDLQALCGRCHMKVTLAGRKYGRL